MQDLRTMLPSAMHEEVYEEVRRKLSERFSFNIYGELKTFIRVEIYSEIKRENPYLTVGFYSVFDKAWERAYKDIVHNHPTTTPPPPPSTAPKKESKT